MILLLMIISDSLRCNHVSSISRRFEKIVHPPPHSLFHHRGITNFIVRIPIVRDLATFYENSVILTLSVLSKKHPCHRRQVTVNKMLRER